MSEFTISEPFCMKPFYKQGETIRLRDSLLENLRHCPFIYDIAYFHKADSIDKPWLEWRKHFPSIFKLWAMTNEELINHFKNRDKKSAKEPMIAMIALLMDAIFWLNERPTLLLSWKEEMMELEITPVNIVERIEFMLESPDHFHAYNQLKSLFMEVEKSYYRKIAINK